MSDQEQARLVAWSEELRRVHGRLREALRVTRELLAEGAPGADASRDLLLYCHGFCVALDGHHRGEDTKLFPAIEVEHPELSPVLRALERDHSMIAHLLSALEAAVEQLAAPDEIERHLEGIAAIMENHFRYEERQLLSVLDGVGVGVAGELRDPSVGEAVEGELGDIHVPASRSVRAARAEVGGDPVVLNHELDATHPPVGERPVPV